MEVVLVRYSITIFAFASVVFGVPIPEIAEERFHGWVSEPRERGTFSIVMSCVVTLVLCIWTAVHPDVLVGATTCQRYRDRLGWMLMALLTPDVVIMHAYSQWHEARRIHKLSLSISRHNAKPMPTIRPTNQAAGNISDTSVNLKDEKAGKTLKTEAKMKGSDSSNANTDVEDGARGPQGISIGMEETDNPLDKDPELKNEAAAKSSETRIYSIYRRYRTRTDDNNHDLLGMEGAFFAVMGGYALAGEPLSPETFEAFLLRGGFIPNQFKHKDIMDKRNLGTLGKLLVCFQAFRLVIPFVVRKASGLPVSLLELHVVIQVLIAGVMYFFWFKKPLDANEPINLEIVAGPPLPPTETRIKQVSLLDFKDTLLLFNRSLRPSMYLESLQAAGPKNPQRPTTPESPQSPVSNLEIIKGSWCGLIFYLLYAALHAIAWDSHFPTPIECLLWKISCIVVGTAPIGLLVDTCIRNLVCHMSLSGYRGFVHHTLIIAYAMSSMFLLLETFISLRRLPSGVYKTVPLEDYLRDF